MQSLTIQDIAAYVQPWGTLQEFPGAHEFIPTITTKEVFRNAFFLTEKGSLVAEVHGYQERQFLPVEELRDVRRALSLLPIEITRIANLSNLESGWRFDPSYVHVMRGTPWGNPISHWAICCVCGERHREYDREGLLACYVVWLKKRPLAWKERAKATLQNKILVCCCAPDACHAEVLADFIECVGEFQEAPCGT